MKLNPDMENVEIYKRAKFQIEISYNMVYAKINKSNICSSEQCKHIKSKSLSDFVIFMEAWI
jgi:hypothetical protein